MHFCVQYFVGEKVTRAVSKALFISTVTKTVRGERRFWLKPSSICWVRILKKVGDGWFFLNPCWEGERRIWDSKRGRSIFSMTLERVSGREIGL